MSGSVEGVVLREAASAARDFIMRTDNASGCCMCGSAVDGHGIGDGHAPVDDGIYYAMQIVEAIDAALTAPPARTYAEGVSDEDVARIIDPQTWRCYDATLRPFQENRGAHEGESWHVRAYQAGCRSADDADRWWRETANDVEPCTVQLFRASLTKAAAICLLSQGEKA